MIPATDSAQSTPKRITWLLLTILSGLVGPGCGQLRSFREKEAPPAFGTVASEHGPRSDDAYAEKLSPSVKRSKDALVREDRSRKDESLAVATPSNHPLQDGRPVEAGGNKSHLNDRTIDEPLVALQPPVSIPSLSRARGRETIVASRPEAHTSENQSSSHQESIPKAVAVSPFPKSDDLTSVLAESRLALEKVSNYQVKMSHQQRIGLTLQSPEDVVMSIRRKPKAVRIEWPDGASKGREVLYSADLGSGQMHVRMPNPLLPRISMAPDGPLAVRSSRHPITEAGFDTILEGMEVAVHASMNGDNSYGKISYEGTETPIGLSKPCNKIVRVATDGEVWVVYLDTQSYLPALVQASSARGELLERHVFREVTLNVPELVSREAFDPEARWGPNQGFFQRLARAPIVTDAPTQRR